MILSILHECRRLNLGEPVAISAAQNEGISDLYVALKNCNDTLIGEAAADSDEDAGPSSLEEIKVAIVGRPNAGKSTLLNRIVGEERVITGPTPGLTRDTVAVDWQHDDYKMHIVDTAGLRRKGKLYEASRTSIVEGKASETDKILESFASSESYRAIASANVVAVVVDVTAEMIAPKTKEDTMKNLERDALTAQDKNIISRALEEGKGVVVVANKVDLLPEKFSADESATLPGNKDIENWVSGQLTWSGARGIPVVARSAADAASAATVKERLFPTVIDVYRAWDARINTSRLLKSVREYVEDNPPPKTRSLLGLKTRGNKRGVLTNVKVKFATQTSSRPPTIALHVNKTDKKNSLDETYMAYLEKRLRSDFDLWGVPVRFDVVASKNPYRRNQRLGGKASKLKPHSSRRGTYWL